MIKLIMTAGHFNCDRMLENMLQMAKEHPEMLGGQKLPPFADKMIRMVPADKKNEMMAQSLKTQKSQMLPQVEQGLSRVVGPARLADVDMDYVKGGPDVMTLMLEFTLLDHDYFIMNVLPQFYSEYTAPQMLGETYSGPYDLISVQHYMRAQEPKRRELLIAKSISTNRSFVMQMLQQMGSASGMELKLNNIRVMIR